MFKHSRWGKRGMLVHRRQILNADMSWSCNCLYLLPCMLNPIYFKSTFLFLCLSTHIDNRNLHNVHCVSDYCSSVAKLCPTKPNLPGSCLWDSAGRNTGVGGYFLLQGIFSTQGSNPCLLLGRQILYLVKKFFVGQISYTATCVSDKFVYFQIF